MPFILTLWQWCVSHRSYLEHYDRNVMWCLGLSLQIGIAYLAFQSKIWNCSVVIFLALVTNAFISMVRYILFLVYPKLYLRDYRLVAVVYVLIDVFVICRLRSCYQSRPVVALFWVFSLAILLPVFQEDLAQYDFAAALLVRDIRVWNNTFAMILTFLVLYDDPALHLKQENDNG